MGCSMQRFPVLYYLPMFAQIYIHWVNDAIQSYPLQVAQIQIPPPFGSYVTLGKFIVFELSEPQFSHCKMGMITVPTV